MDILMSIYINETNQKKIGWAMGNYSNELPDDVECKDWLEANLQDTFNELSLPPE